jgi:alpha-L-fucosidase
MEPEPTPGDTDWFAHDRFGLFIHWGLYSLAARHEWVQSREKIDAETYRKYFDRFDPDLYDPEMWAETAARAGMKYAVVTTKHHEGFCLWDTQLTDYKAPNTPAGRDLLRPLIEAFRARDLKMGLYHSLLDWHHPDYTADGCHPMREDEDWLARDKDRDMRRYADYLHAQTRELLTQFGKIDVMWFDFSVPEQEGFPGKGKDAWRSRELIDMVRELQPGIIINNRLEIEQDIRTPEQFMPRRGLCVDGKPVLWEACHTFSGSWGYHRDEESWKSVDQLVKMLIEAVSKGGNLLLNVGPTARGEFDPRALDRLAGIGEWMKRHSRSIYGCTEAPAQFATPDNCLYTYNPDARRLYLHVLSWPFRHIHLDGMRPRVEYAQLLNDASEVQMLDAVPQATWHGMKDGRAEDTLTLELPVRRPDVTVPVVELFLKD